MSARDRFGVLWRPELAAALLLRADEVDVVEVNAEDWLDVPRSRADALRTLAAHVPVVLHATSLGLATGEDADRARIDRMARLCEIVGPESWSEHLAFVRGGGVEIGHLAAPPRTRRTIDGLARNVALAARVVGSRPALENVATLIAPPASTMDEPSWISACIAATGCPLLLDLHNLHANAVNFGFDAAAALDRLPLQAVTEIHVAGGRWITRGSARRLLDDHLHDVPDPVYTLVEELGARCAQRITVILERDAQLPSFDDLLAQLARARTALAAGRARAAAHAA
ncbi:MAG: DUF692 domain-containing protein [Planctomycetes bacterium]|nr:DUF692 domain-containing protein [Planctomycetota bacterium]